jgi:ferredoxin-NADP reductase
MRCFSIIGGLQEGTIRFAVRIGGPFSRAMARLRVGDVLRVKGPFGDFYIDRDDTRAVMFASGIGITPFLSMLQERAVIPTTLLYSNRSADAIPFYDELCDRAARNPSLRVGFFASKSVDAPRSVIPGRISEKHIQKVTGSEYAGSTYFICGPSKFSQEIEALLLSNGVTPDHILCESFTQKMKSSRETYGSIRRWTYGLSFATLALLIGGIMVLDLSRAVPKLASQQIHMAQLTGQTNQSTSSGSSTSAAGGNSDNTSDSTSMTTTPVQTPTYYQPPVSSVS